MTRRTSNEARESVVLALRDGPQRPMTIATKSGLSTSVVHRHLLALKAEGLVSKDDENGTWVLTGKTPSFVSVAQETAARINSAPIYKDRLKKKRGTKKPARAITPSADEPNESAIDAETPEGALIILAIEGLEIGVEALPASNPARAKLQARHTLLMRELQSDA